MSDIETAVLRLLRRRPKRGWEMAELHCALCCRPRLKDKALNPADVSHAATRLALSGRAQLTPDWRIVPLKEAPRA